MVSRQQKRQAERAMQRAGVSPQNIPDLSRQKPAQFAQSIDEIEMVGDFLLIELHQPGESEGGIALPGGYNEGMPKGTVMKAGPGQLRDDGTRSPMECKVGERVFMNLARHAVSYEIGGKEYVLTPDASVIMKVAATKPAVVSE